ncbi:MAG: hypothetical protein WCF03_16145, partial [Nitrososphaeraceae archaeon]
SSGMNAEAPPKIEIAWTYQDMVSAIVERVQLCRYEILLAPGLQHNRESNFISLWPARRKISET